MSSIIFCLHENNKYSYSYIRNVVYFDTTKIYINLNNLKYLFVICGNMLFVQEYCLFKNMIPNIFDLLMFFPCAIYLQIEEVLVYKT